MDLERLKELVKTQCKSQDKHEAWEWRGALELLESLDEPQPAPAETDWMSSAESAYMGGNIGDAQAAAAIAQAKAAERQADAMERIANRLEDKAWQ